jgi:hypothetical protein
MIYGKHEIRAFLAGQAGSGAFDEDAPGPTNIDRWRRILQQVSAVIEIVNVKDEYGTQPVGFVSPVKLVTIRTAQPSLLVHAVDTVTHASRRVRRCVECGGLLLEPSDYGVCTQCEEEVIRLAKDT